MCNAKVKQILKVVGAGALGYLAAELLTSAGRDQGVFDTGKVLWTLEPELTRQLVNKIGDDLKKD
jgi:ketopantoate reductase